MFVLLSVFYVCIFLCICTFVCTIICILCLYVPFLLSVFYVCTFSIICILLSVLFLLSVFYVCTYIFYTYIYCYVAIGEHWRRLFWSKVNISENCVFIFSLDFQLFPTFSEASFLADIFGPDGRICVKFWS